LTDDDDDDDMAGKGGGWRMIREFESSLALRSQRGLSLGLGARCSMLDARRSILDSRFSMLSTTTATLVVYVLDC
jgi:hypothetical protein